MSLPPSSLRFVSLSTIEGMGLLPSSNMLLPESSASFESCNFFATASTGPSSPKATWLVPPTAGPYTNRQSAFVVDLNQGNKRCTQWFRGDPTSLPEEALEQSAIDSSRPHGPCSSTWRHFSESILNSTADPSEDRLAPSSSLETQVVLEFSTP
jgi:hypothetical protein